MQPAARVSATIELLDTLLKRWANGEPVTAEATLKDYGRTRRYIGSGDRRAIGDLVFSVFRRHRLLEWHLLQAGLPVDGRGLMLAHLAFSGEDAETLFNGEAHAPAPLTAKEIAATAVWLKNTLADPAMPPAVAGNVPDELWPLLTDERDEAEAAALAAALMEEAPVDIRVNLSRTSGEKLQRALASQGIEAALVPGTAAGLRMQGKPKLLTLPEHAQGHFELQDASSQYCIAALDPRPGELVIDYCAGGGGKTVAIADAMRGNGRLIACDISSTRLQSIHPRMQRLGLERMVEYIALNDGRLNQRLQEFRGRADRVLVDAPCSGSGTWRRHPDLRLRTPVARIDELAQLQAAILGDAAELVKPGGCLVYATCSVFAVENALQVRRFLTAHRDFTLVGRDGIWDNHSMPPQAVDTMYHCSPHRTQTDGFFFAILQRAAR